MKLKTLTLSLSLALFTACSSAKSTSSSNSLLAQLPKALDGILAGNNDDYVHDLANRAQDVYHSTKAGQKARYESAYVMAMMMKASALVAYDSHIRKEVVMPDEQLAKMLHLFESGKELLKEACNNGKGLKEACKELKK